MFKDQKTNGEPIYALANYENNGELVEKCRKLLFSSKQKQQNDNFINPKLHKNENKTKKTPAKTKTCFDWHKLIDQPINTNCNTETNNKNNDDDDKEELAKNREAICELAAMITTAVR